MNSLSLVARSTLTAVAAYWAALWVFGGAVDLILDSSVEMAPVKQPLLLGWLLVALALLAARFTPESIRVPAVIGLTVSLAVGTALAHHLSGLIAPWIQISIAAGMVLTSVGFVFPARLFPVALVVATFVLLPQRIGEIARPDSPVRPGVMIMEAALVVGLGLLSLLVRAVLVRSAEQADAAMAVAETRRAAVVAERARQDALSAQMTLLHDTALNTLAALALRPGDDTDDIERERLRCRDDARRLREFADTDVTGHARPHELLDSLVERARSLGVTLSLDVAGGVRDVPPLPQPVVRAVVGALDEAVLNVAKHAQVASAHLRVELAAGYVAATLTDGGVGFDTDTAGDHFGLRHSIEGRMTAIGGTAEVTSRPGAGTTVALHWAERPRWAERKDDAVSEVVRRLVLALIVATTVVTSMFVVAEWRAFERPAVALAGSLILGAWGLVVTTVLRHRRWIPTTFGVVTVLLACVAPFWTISADQYCASSFGTLGWIDPRIPLVVAVILTAGHWWRASLAAPAFVAATVVAGQTWGAVFDRCETWAETASTLAVVVFGASLIAGRTLNKQAHAMNEAAATFNAARDETVRVASIHAERRYWFQSALDACVPLLAAIGDGQLDPREESVRHRCQSSSGYLRGLLAAASAPDGVRDVLLDLVRRGHLAGLTIDTRGDFSRLPAATPELAATLRGSLPATFGPARAMVITASGDAHSATLIVHIPDLVEADRRVPSERECGADVVLVVDDDGWWQAVTWSAAEAEPLAATQ